MSYGPHTRNPYEDDFAHERDEAAEQEAEHYSPCACGDSRCSLDDRDSTNVRVGQKWFAADCVGLCSHCGQVDDLKAFYRESYGRLRHTKACGDSMNERRR